MAYLPSFETEPIAPAVQDLDFSTFLNDTAFDATSTPYESFPLSFSSSSASDRSSSHGGLETPEQQSLFGPSPATWTQAFKSFSQDVAVASPADSSIKYEDVSPAWAPEPLALDPSVLSSPLFESPFTGTMTPPTERAASPPMLPTPAPAISAAKHKLSASARASNSGARPTGTRPSAVPPIPLDAPPQPKSYRCPSATSRKVLPAKHAKRLAEAAVHPEGERRGRGRPRKITLPAVQAFDPETGGKIQIPKELQDEIERDRERNRLSARESRARKAAMLKGLEDRVAELEGELDKERQSREAAERRCRELEALLAVA